MAIAESTCKVFEEMEEKANRQETGSRIARSTEPLNLEMEFPKLASFTTLTDSFYVRCHFPIPHIASETWRLTVDGAVENPFALTYAELIAMDAVTIHATLECAGNSRDLLEAKVKGVPWTLGAVGNATWRGVRLAAVLARAGVKAGATEVILEGADEGKVKEPPHPDGEIRFARSIPLRKALDDVLLVHEMNGAPLRAEHGYPVRAIVPGWYAVASVKWLRRIVVADRPFNGYYQTTDYAYWDRRGEFPELVPISEMNVKAQIARPENGAVVPANSNVCVNGAAWSGGGATIDRVDLSFDGGKVWEPARLLGSAVANAWRLWEFHWLTPAAPGKVTLMARAFDSRGRTQAMARDLNRGTYMIDHVLPIEVEVR